MRKHELIVFTCHLSAFSLRNSYKNSRFPSIKYQYFKIVGKIKDAGLPLLSFLYNSKLYAGLFVKLLTMTFHITGIPAVRLLFSCFC